VVFSDCPAQPLGCQVALRHSDGTVLVYAHLASRDVAVGEGWVPQGEILGRAGRTGLNANDAEHLHVELRNGADQC
jgi:murein DD-endopeptidase MepM/ murein hydrolase activator NlpD